MLRLRGRFKHSDVAQQIVGGLLLSGPFVVTEEVWTLAAEMTFLQSLGTVFLVLAVGYGALFQADNNRPLDREKTILWIPLRYLSLILVSYLSVAILAFVLGAPDTFGVSLATTARAISVGAIFSVVGAATADSIL